MTPFAVSLILLRRSVHSQSAAIGCMARDAIEAESGSDSMGIAGRRPHFTLHDNG